MVKKFKKIRNLRKQSLDNHDVQQDLNKGNIEKQIEEIKEIVKQQTETIKDKESMLPNRPDFPTRFSAKPFVHYGNTLKLAAIKKKETEKMINSNNNQMKQYIALLQKQKNTQKPTIEKLSVEMQSPRTRDLETSKIHGNPTLQSPSKINITTSSPNQSMTSIKPCDAPTCVDTSKLLPAATNPVTSELSEANKSILDKNSDYIHKKKIINSIGEWGEGSHVAGFQFDDRCELHSLLLGINYRKAHRSLVDLTVGYLHRSKVDKHIVAEPAVR